ncbi:hypothetical protein [Calothrix sp. 336/3]|uniref:hypothetical protein n=1 Tax=Calothrix sp. 336/3 TaxID=1337936 RepID=UPI0004E41FCE|nr:hypothetical protein [Calothrix sp. 336/3]
MQFLKAELCHELGFHFPDFDKLSGEHDYFLTKEILGSDILLIAGSAEIFSSTLRNICKLNTDWNEA